MCTRPKQFGGSKNHFEPIEGQGINVLVYFETQMLSFKDAIIKSLLIFYFLGFKLSVILAKKACLKLHNIRHPEPWPEAA